MCTHTHTCKDSISLSSYCTKLYLYKNIGLDPLECFCMDVTESGEEPQQGIMPKSLPFKAAIISSGTGLGHLEIDCNSGRSLLSPGSSGGWQV